MEQKQDPPGSWQVDRKVALPRHRKTFNTMTASLQCMAGTIPIRNMMQRRVCYIAQIRKPPITPRGPRLARVASVTQNSFVTLCNQAEQDPQLQKMLDRPGGDSCTIS